MQEQIKYVALGVFAETSNGSHPDEVIAAKAWVFFNRSGVKDQFTAIEYSNNQDLVINGQTQRLQYPAWVGIVNAFYGGERKSYDCLNDPTCGAPWYASIPVEQRRAALDQAYNCYLGLPGSGCSGSSSFKRVNLIVESVYSQYSQGSPDPTGVVGGARYFSDQGLERKDNNGNIVKGFASGTELREWLITNMENYKKNNPNFAYWVSQPFNAKGEIKVAITGNELCITSGSCR